MKKESDEVTEEVRKGGMEERSNWRASAARPELALNFHRKVAQLSKRHKESLTEPWPRLGEWASVS